MSTSNHFRNSTINHQEVYFWTATIHNWNHLLETDSMKMEIINSLQFLTIKKLIEVYGYVIMPNHIHLVWKMLQQNGKESPHSSLLKFTAHQFKKRLKAIRPELLNDYYVGTQEKEFEFWQRDSLVIPLFSKEVIIQKMDYVHKNAVSKKWLLAESAYDYRFSSANFYETGLDEFGIITHVNAIL